MTTTQDDEFAVRRFFQAFYAADDAVLGELLGAGFAAHGPGGVTVDAAGWTALAHELAAALPDNETEVDDVVAAGDRVVVRYTSRGTHSGVMFGVAPTGRSLTTSGIEIYRLEEGRIVECWGRYDMTELFGSAC